MIHFILLIFCTLIFGVQIGLMLADIWSLTSDGVLFGVWFVLMISQIVIMADKIFNKSDNDR